jgi:ribosomal protein L9
MGLLVSLNSKLKLKEKLTENEIRRLSESILAKYSSLKIADIIYVFNQIADGEIDLFGSLSHRDIMKALYDYNKTRWKHKNY